MIVNISCEDCTTQCIRTQIEQYLSMVKELLVDCCQCEVMVIVPSLLMSNVMMAMGFLGGLKMGSICVERS